MSNYAARVGHARRVRRDDAIARHVRWQVADEVATASRRRTVVPPPDLDAYRVACVALARHLIAADPTAPLPLVRSRFAVAASEQAPVATDLDTLEFIRHAAWAEATS